MITEYLAEPYILVFWVAIAIAFAYTLWPQREDDDLHGERLIDEIERKWLRDSPAADARRVADACVEAVIRERKHEEKDKKNVTRAGETA